MTAKTVEALLSPFVLGSLKLKNRVVLAPMTRARAGAEGIANALMAKYYSQRTGAGLIITEATQISEQALGWLHAPRMYTEKHAEGWKVVVNAVHEKNTPIFLQLWHCGRASHSSFHNGDLPVAPSAIAIQGDSIHAPAGKVPYETPRALTKEEIKQTVKDYVHAADLAKKAGFDGVEVHSANGYLLDEFLQSKTNKRTDEYGGSIENRFRFLKEAVEGVIAVWGKDKVAVRLSPNGIYNDMGSPDFRETFTYVAEQLDKFDLAYLHVLDGLAFGFHNIGEPMSLLDFRKVFHKPLMGNCGYEKESAEKGIESGAADLIAFGRPFISNPDLVERFANGWELNPPADMKAWYSFDEHGYTDFPQHK